MIGWFDNLTGIDIAPADYDLASSILQTINASRCTPSSFIVLSSLILLGTVSRPLCHVAASIQADKSSPIISTFITPPRGFWPPKLNATLPKSMLVSGFQN